MWIEQKEIRKRNYDYCICIIDNEAYYTNNPFWYWYFHNNEYEKKFIVKNIGIGNIKNKPIYDNKKLIKDTIKGLSDECVKLIEKYPEKAEQLKKEYEQQVKKFNV